VKHPESTPWRPTQLPKETTGFGRDRFSTGRKPASSDSELGQAANPDSGINIPDVSLVRRDARAVPSDAFSDALKRVISTSTGRGEQPVPAWGTIPGLTDTILRHSHENSVSTHSSSTQPRMTDEAAEPTIAMQPARSVFSDVILNEATSRRELELAEEDAPIGQYQPLNSAAFLPGEHRSRISEVSRAPQAPFIDSGHSRELLAAGFPTNPALDGAGASPTSSFGIEGLSLRADSSLSIPFAGMARSPSAAFPPRMGVGESLGPQTLINSASLSQTNSGSQLLDLSADLGGFSRFLGEGNLELPGSSTVDPSIVGLRFPGLGSVEPTRGMSPERSGSYMPLGAVGNAPFGQFDSSLESSDRGSSLDLSKTNDLLQQLLDEVRKGRQPFLPMNDRNSSF
jgi:hypothetical protein